MPEYPDITIYIEALEERILNKKIEKVLLKSPFLLRTASPPLSNIVDKKVVSIRRIGKRIAFGIDDENYNPGTSIWMVLHLMIAGRLHWKEDAKKIPAKTSLISWIFENGGLYLTESGSKKRASLHMFEDEASMKSVNPGGLEVMEASLDEFKNAITAQNHTLKRTMTDPRILSGIGNAYSDEILHRAKLSPILMTNKLTVEEIKRLFGATVESLEYWTELLRNHYRGKFPEKVTAFREEMAVHGKYKQPCPVCDSPVQRIRYSSNETNYCPTCQTKGKVLADRSLSRLLKKDWPRTLDELEKLRQVPK